MSQAQHATPPNTGGAGKTLGIIAIVCGGVGICIPGMALVGLVLGVLGLAMSATGQKKLPGIGTGVSGLTLLLNLAMIVLILIPALRAARESAQMAQEMSQLREIGSAFYAYAADNKDLCPPHASELLIYVSDPGVFTAPPADPTNTVLPGVGPGDDFTQPYTYGSFTFTPLAGIRTSQILEPSTTIIAYSDQPRGVSDEYRAVLFGDGHIERIDEADFPQLLAQANQHVPPVNPLWQYRP